MAIPSLLVAAFIANAPCEGRTQALVTWTDAHRLYVCEGGRATAEYPVALGRDGVSPPKEFSDKTPLGTWPLGPPRASAKYRVFIPFRGNYGLHGPARAFRFAGQANVSVDWTLGCIAVATDDIIQSVAAWVRLHPSARLHIERGAR